MRVFCEYGGEQIESEIVAGFWLDMQRTAFDWDSGFTLRCDNGELFWVNGNICDVEVLKGSVEDLRACTYL